MINSTVEGTLKLPTLPADRSDPKVYWEFLRPRLSQLVQMEKVWGNIHDFYPVLSAKSITEEVHVPWNIRNPDSRFSTNWDLAQVMIVMEQCRWPVEPVERVECTPL